MRSEENSGLSARNAAVRGDVAQPGAVERGQHPPGGGLLAGQHRDVVVQRRYRGHLGSLGGQARPARRGDVTAPRRRGRVRAQPGGGGRRDAERRGRRARGAAPTGWRAAARRDDHDRAVAQVPDGRAEQRRPGAAARPRPGWRTRWPGRPPAGCGPGGAARTGRSPPPGWRPRRGRRGTAAPGPVRRPARAGGPSTSTISISRAGPSWSSRSAMLTPPALAPELPPGAQRGGPDRRLEPQLLALERASGHALPPGSLQLAGHLAQRGQVRAELRVGGRPYRRDGQRGRPPALAPGQQQPGPACPGRVPLRERGQLGTVRGGLRPQLRRAQGQPVLVQDLKPAAAGGEQAPRVLVGVAPAAPR